MNERAEKFSQTTSSHSHLPHFSNVCLVKEYGKNKRRVFHVKEGVCSSYGIHVVELSSGMIIYMQNVSPPFKESKRSRYEAVRDFY